MPGGTEMRGRWVAALVMVMLLAGCGSSAKKGGPPASSGSTAPQNTTLAQGVTASEVKVGVSLTDFSCIKQFVDAVREGQQQIYQNFIDYMNAHGGIAGRKIRPVFDQFCPIPNAQLLSQVCTHFTDDEKVFAVIANLYDTTGVAEACIA